MHFIPSEQFVLCILGDSDYVEAANSGRRFGSELEGATWNTFQSYLTLWGRSQIYANSFSNRADIKPWTGIPPESIKNTVINIKLCDVLWENVWQSNRRYTFNTRVNVIIMALTESTWRSSCVFFRKHWNKCLSDLITADLWAVMTISFHCSPRIVFIILYSYGPMCLQ